MNLSGKTIFITGSNGFLGRHLKTVLLDRGAREVCGFRSADFDLTKPSHALSVIETTKPDLVIHAAARVGGILANKRQPYTFGRDNLLMGVNVLDACIRYRVPKLVLIGSTCSYPLVPTTFPFAEESLWEGYPEPTNGPYGVAKRVLGSLIEIAVSEGRLACGTMAIPSNLYGPGENFDRETSHAIPAMIRRLCEAVDQNLSEVTCWGSGYATRDFLHVRDAAEGIARIAEAWDNPTPVNLGTGVEVSIREMAHLVADIVGYKGRILWSEQDGLDGQPHRALDATRAWASLGWEAKIPFRLGMEETVNWWREQCQATQR